MTPPSEQSEVEELTTLFKYAVTRGAFNDLKATSIRIAEILDALSAAPAPEPEGQTFGESGLEALGDALDEPADDAETFTSEANVYIQWMKDRGLWGTADTPTDADLRALVDTVRADERRQWCEALDAIGCPSTPEKATAAVKSYAGYVEHGVRADERRKCAEACRSMAEVRGKRGKYDDQATCLECAATIEQQGGASDE